MSCIPLSTDFANFVNIGSFSKKSATVTSTAISTVDLTLRSCNIKKIEKIRFCLLDRCWILCYNDNIGIFMEEFHKMGILSFAYAYYYSYFYFYGVK